MRDLIAATKIKTWHTLLIAIVYIRQSGMHQVLTHKASGELQRLLRQQALDMGWPADQILVIDEDQGHSSTLGAPRRRGFEHMLALITEGKIGALFCLEPDRLARATSAWARLFEVCTVTDTLVISPEGIWDLNSDDDSFKLDILAVLSKVEARKTAGRTRRAREYEASKGTLRFHPPTGFVYDRAHQLVYDPDEHVRLAIAEIFALFGQLSSAQAVASTLWQRGTDLPIRSWGGPRAGDLMWVKPTLARVLETLRNPFFAGAYAYGRTAVQLALVAGEPRRRTVNRPEPEDWRYLRLDHHPGYISWNQYLANQRILKANRAHWLATYPDTSKAHTGAALTGLIHCGLCGRALTPHYRSAAQFTYRKRSKSIMDCQCPSINGPLVNGAVIEAFLTMIHPAEVAVTLAASAQADEAHEREVRESTRRLERAEQAEMRAQRRYKNLDPDDPMLVGIAQELLRDWRETMAERDRLRREISIAQQVRQAALNATERQELLQVADLVRAAWSAETTTSAERKLLLGTLIKEVFLVKGETTVRIMIRWQTDACTLVEIARPKVGCGNRTAPETLDRIRELAPICTDRQIAERLNQEGYRSRRSRLFNEDNISSLRLTHRIRTDARDMSGKPLPAQRADGRYSTAAVAEILHVTPATIAIWCRKGKLDAVRDWERGFWWVHLEKESIEKLRRPP